MTPSAWLAFGGIAALLITILLVIARTRSSRTRIRADDGEPTHFETTAAEQRRGAAREAYLMARAPRESSPPVPLDDEREVCRRLTVDGMARVDG
eukprot:4835553-Prymnesium_polylepis.1